MSATTHLVASELADMLEGYDDPAILLQQDCRIVATNAAYQHVFGAIDLSSPKYCYQVSHGYLGPCHQAGEDCPLKSSLASGQRRRMVHLHHTPRGEEHVDEETVPLRNRHGETALFLQLLRPTHIASAQFSLDGMVGRSQAVNGILDLISRVAPSQTAVLLLGETGTGKELAAQAIHQASQRRDKPFVPLDCSGLTKSLFESELFGHEKGAFTGALSAKPGLVEAAHGGTLFLDEIGDVQLQLQVKLLRLLETESFRRVGSVETRTADFRLICATHQDLPAMCDTGRFRKDLFYRISVFPITVPPLRERRADIPLLAEVMLHRLVGEQSPQLDPKTLACLVDYDYPGNVRELKHILERALLLTDGDTVLPAALPDECRSDAAKATAEIVSLKEAEDRYLRYLSVTYTGDKKTLAERLGISGRTLYRKLEELKDEPGSTDSQRTPERK